MSEGNVTLAGALEMLLGSRKLLILTHDRPDGDTLGCAAALKSALARGGRQVEVICGDVIREDLRFLFGGADRLTAPEGFEPDLVCAVDVASRQMIGSLGGYGTVDLRIDHHGTGELFAKYNYVEADAAACGEIIYEMLRSVPLMTKEAADALYTAISSDTGCFRFRNTTARTHRIAADLADAGADVAGINHRIFETRSPSELEATRLALDGLRYHADGRIAVIGFTNEMKSKYGVTEDDISPLHALPREISGVLLGITVRQQAEDPEEYRVSLRSGVEVDSAAICAQFGGGGHKGAAGCNVRAGSLEEAEKMIVEAAKKAL